MTREGAGWCYYGAMAEGNGDTIRNSPTPPERCVLCPQNSGLPKLAAAYRTLDDLSKREAGAVLPFVVAAYRYGFAAWEAGDGAAAREALEAAVEKYPYGKNAERARGILER